MKLTTFGTMATVGSILPRPTDTSSKRWKTLQTHPSNQFARLRQRWQWFAPTASRRFVWIALQNVSRSSAVAKLGKIEMADTTPFYQDHPGVELERRRPKNAFDAKDNYSGQEYSPEREQAEGQKHPAGEVDPKASRDSGKGVATGEIEPDAGRRAWVDPDTGEVHGSGAGAGGGNNGEDYDHGSKGGGGLTPTGR